MFPQAAGIKIFTVMLLHGVCVWGWLAVPAVGELAVKPGEGTTAVDLTRAGILSRVCGRGVLSCVGHAWQVRWLGHGLLLGTAAGHGDASLAWRRTELGRSVRCVSVQ